MIYIFSFFDILVTSKFIPLYVRHTLFEVFILLTLLIFMVSKKDEYNYTVSCCLINIYDFYKYRESFLSLLTGQKIKWREA